MLLYAAKYFGADASSSCQPSETSKLDNRRCLPRDVVSVRLWAENSSEL